LKEVKRIFYFCWSIFLLFFMNWVWFLSNDLLLIS
jgi:hypothetical protein